MMMMMTIIIIILIIIIIISISIIIIVFVIVIISIIIIIIIKAVPGYFQRHGMEARVVLEHLNDPGGQVGALLDAAHELGMPCLESEEEVHLMHVALVAAMAEAAE